MAIAERLPDAFADAASDPALTADEQRVGETIRDGIAAWATARSRELA